MLTRRMGFTNGFLAPIVAGGLMFLTGCPGETPTASTSGTPSAPQHDQPAATGDHGHHHHAEQGPHGGALVALGQDDAHLEIVLNGESGVLTAYVLDGAAEKPVAIRQKTLQLALTLEHDHHAHGDKDHHHDADKEKPGADVKTDEDKDDVPDETLVLSLTAVSPGEEGAASEFSGQADELKGADEFAAALTGITIGGKEFKGVSFKYPEGNEHDHHH